MLEAVSIEDLECVFVVAELGPEEAGSLQAFLDLHVLDDAVPAFLLQFEVKGLHEIHHGLQHLVWVVELAMGLQQHGQVQFPISAQRSALSSSEVGSHFVKVEADLLYIVGFSVFGLKDLDGLGVLRLHLSANLCFRLFLDDNRRGSFSFIGWSAHTGRF